MARTGFEVSPEMDGSPAGQYFRARQRQRRGNAVQQFALNKNMSRPRAMGPNYKSEIFWSGVAKAVNSMAKGNYGEHGAGSPGRTFIDTLRGIKPAGGQKGGGGAGQHNLAGSGGKDRLGAGGRPGSQGGVSSGGGRAPTNAANARPANKVPPKKAAPKVVVKRPAPKPVPKKGQKTAPKLTPTQLRNLQVGTGKGGKGYSTRDK